MKIKTIATLIFLSYLTMAGLVPAQSSFLPSANAQSSSLFTTPSRRMEQRATLTLSDASFISRPMPAERTFREHDLVMVVVKNNWQALTNGKMERKRKMNSEYGISKWISFDGLNFGASNLSNGAPAVAGKIDSQFKNEGSVKRQDMIQFKIACHIDSILDNGVLYLSGTDTISFGEETKKIAFSGYVRPEDIQPDNSVLSERIYMGTIQEIPSGSVYDSYRRNWGQKMIDRWSPF